MTQEDKDLLLKDLACRLPYGVKAHIEHDTFYDEIEPYDGTVNTNTINDLLHNEKLEVRPYLRPVSSMTEEEMDRLFEILDIDKNGEDEDWIKINDCTGIKFLLPTGRWMEEMDNALGYLRSIHIDIQGLIGKGLALEAPEGMYK